MHTNLKTYSKFLIRVQEEQHVRLLLVNMGP